MKVDILLNEETKLIQCTGIIDRRLNPKTWAGEPRWLVNRILKCSYKTNVNEHLLDIVYLGILHTSFLAFVVYISLHDAERLLQACIICDCMHNYVYVDISKSWLVTCASMILSLCSSLIAFSHKHRHTHTHTHTQYIYIMWFSHLI